MTVRRFSLVNIPRWASIAAVLVALMPGTVFATDFEFSRLASQIELISAQLATDLRYTRHYGSVRQRAVTLRREASQLVDSLQRNRGNSRIRSKFKDVRRGYERLEQAFFTADRRDHDPRLYREISHLSTVFTNLSDEFYYAGMGGQSYGPGYNAPYRGIVIQGLGHSRSRHPGLHQNPNRQGGRFGGAERSGRGKPGRAGLDRGSRRVQSAPPSSHRSNVLERQGRQNTARRELERQARHNRSPELARQSSRGVNMQRGRSTVVETRRRYQYK
tara:strand:+ start:21344 stop:22165 length:822 start_codon:yes stop_codon:yes gene_type:complete